MYVRVYVCMHVCMPAGVERDLISVERDLIVCMPAGARSARSMYVCIYLYTTAGARSAVGLCRQPTVLRYIYSCILFICNIYLLEDVLPLGGVNM